MLPANDYSIGRGRDGEQRRTNGRGYAFGQRNFGRRP
jgi:hypothetical protein